MSSHTTRSQCALGQALVSMYEHGCQIWQIHLATFGGNVNTQKETAFDFTVELAMAYTSDNINKYELLQRRCDKVEALGLGRPKRGGEAKRLVAASDGADLPGAGVSVAASDGGAHVLIANGFGEKTSVGSQEEACSCCCPCSGCSV